MSTDKRPSQSLNPVPITAQANTVSNQSAINTDILQTNSDLLRIISQYISCKYCGIVIDLYANWLQEKSDFQWRQEIF